MRAAIVVVLLLAGPAAAQDAMYATSQGNGGTANISYAASQVAPAAGKAYGAFAQGGLSYSTTFAGTLEKDYEPGMWELRVQLSCDRPTVYRPTTTTDVYRPTVTSTLTVAGKALPAVHGESTLRTCDGPSDVWRLAWTIDGSAAEPNAGAAVSWVTSVWWLNPPPGAAQNGYFLIGPEGTGLFGLVPVPATAAPLVINGTLEEPFDQTFGQPFNGTYRLNATVLEDRVLVIDALHDAGSLVFAIEGADGPVYDRNATGSFNETVALVPGDYVVVLSLQAFVGRIVVDWAAEEAPGQGGGNQTTPPGSTGQDPGNTTDEPQAKDTPLPMALAVAALVGVAVRRRRN